MLRLLLEFRNGLLGQIALILFTLSPIFLFLWILGMLLVLTKLPINETGTEANKTTTSRLRCG